jgi:hypothetical protein
MSKLLAPNGKPSNLTAEQYDLVRTPAFKKWFGDWENNPANASKVVDENGEPLLLYHGTDVNFNVYDLSKIGEGSDLLGKGIYLTENKNVANFYANFVGQKRYIIRYEDGIFDTQNPIYEKDADKKAEKHKVIYQFFVNAKNFIDISKIEVDDNIKEILAKSIRGLFKNELEFVNEKIDFANKNYKQIRDYRGLLLYLIYLFPDTKEEILQYIKNKYDCIRFEPSSEFENNLGEYNNYVVFKPEQIKLADGTNATFDGNNPDIRFDDGGELVGVVKIGNDIYMSKNINELPKDSVIIEHRYYDKIKAGDIGFFAGEIDNVDTHYGDKVVYVSIGKNTKVKSINSTYEYLEEKGILNKPDKYIIEKYGKYGINTYYQLYDEAYNWLDNPNDSFYEFQKRTLQSLKEDGEDFDVLEMFYEDECTPHQYIVTKFDIDNKELKYNDGGEVSVNDLSEKSKEIIDANYEGRESFGFFDFNWNKESERENFKEWLKDFKENQFKKNLSKVIKQVESDINLKKEREKSEIKLKYFEELIIPSLGNEVLTPKLSIYEKQVLLDPNATIESIEKGFIDAKNIIDEDGSINQSKITPSNFIVDDEINLPAFETFVEKNPQYKNVFNDWKKIFDEYIDLSIQNTYAFRYPSVDDLEYLHSELVNIKDKKSKDKFNTGGEVKINLIAQIWEWFGIKF